MLGDERLRVDGGVAEQAPELVGPSKSKPKPKRLGTYLNPAAPLSTQGEMALQLVLSPDNSLSERGAIIGMVNAAQHGSCSCCRTRCPPDGVEGAKSPHRS